MLLLAFVLLSLALASCCLLLLAASQLDFKCKMSSCLSLLLFAWAWVCVGPTKCGTHALLVGTRFEIQLGLSDFLETYP